MLCPLYLPCIPLCAHFMCEHSSNISASFFALSIYLRQAAVMLACRVSFVISTLKTHAPLLPPVCCDHVFLQMYVFFRPIGCRLILNAFLNQMGNCFPIILQLTLSSFVQSLLSAASARALCLRALIVPSPLNIAFKWSINSKRAPIRGLTEFSYRTNELCSELLTKPGFGNEA